MTAGWVKQGGAVLAFDCVIYLDFFLWMRQKKGALFEKNNLQDSVAT